MGRGDWAINERKKRLDAINQAIKTATEEFGCASYQKITSHLMFEWGITKYKIKEYIAMLEDCGFIKVNGDDVTHLGIDGE